MRIRVAQRMKQDTLAQACKIHPAYLSNIERGKRQPSLECMVAIANALLVDIDDVTYMTSVVILEDTEQVSA